MKLRILSIAALVMLMAACSHPNKTVLAPESLFDSKGKQVITSIYNHKQGTMSILYGNPLALNAVAESRSHVPGEVFTLVTWKQQPNPYWFGGDINSELETIEEVKVGQAEKNNPAINYTVLKGDQQAYILKKQERINFILEQKASVFP